ncbi:MAG: serine--tRNA ligase [Candidatus Pacebacteria bacterium]|nr:serine--tRNA ligase [Candidatus Paceibacterota bacterium]
MLDIRYIQENADTVKRNTEDRGSNADVDKTLSLHAIFKAKKQELEAAQRRSNEISSEFSRADALQKSILSEESRTLKTLTATLSQEVASAEHEYMIEMLQIPNLTGDDVPSGNDDTGNVTIKTFGTPTKFNFTPKDHIELGKVLDILDFESGAKVSGSKFYFLKNEGVQLELALVNYALQIAMKYGFSPMSTPELVKDEMITASGFTPRGPESQIYSLTEGGLSLIGTSEIPIGGYFYETTILEDNLPIKIAGISHCFRTEAGSGGRESKGLYRVHQFTKVELYQLVHPQSSTDAHELMLGMEEEFFQGLKLPYRVMNMCKGDLGAPAYKKYDIEAWMPFFGQDGGYGEVTSTSNCTDFQARRLKTRFKPRDGGKPEFVHTLNGTAVAITRTLLAIIENNQNEDGSVTIPEVLTHYLGKTEILPKVKRF